MKKYVVSVSELTNERSRVIREVLATNLIAIVKRYDKEVCAIVPIAEYNRLKALDRKEGEV